MRNYRYQLFETKEQAKDFKKENGGGVLYDLEKELKKKNTSCMAVFTDFDPEKDKFSVEWTETI